MTLPDPRVLAMCAVSRRLRYAAATVLRLSLQRAGQLALGGKRRARREPIVEAEQPDAVGQRLVGGLARAPPAEGDRERAGRDAGVHEATITSYWTAHDSPIVRLDGAMPRRVIQLLVGLVLYGAGCALTIEAGLGVDPWTVFAQGLSVHTGIGIGWITNIVGFFVLLLWIPLRQKPGVGTIANILLVGTSMQVVLWIVPPVSGLVAAVRGAARRHPAGRARLGALHRRALRSRPRDGLMTGMNARLGWPIWLCRALVEVSVLVVGWLLGGTVGIGTVLFAVLIGPLVHVALPLLDTRRTPAASSTAGVGDARALGGRAAPIAARPRQCSRNSGQSLPGVMCACSALFATSIVG